MGIKGTIVHDALVTTTGDAQISFTVGGGSRMGWVKCAPHHNFVSAIGPVRVAAGGGSRIFRDCIIERQRRPFSGDSRFIFYEIRNRLWRHEEGGGAISGWYNRRKKDGSVDEATEKTPRQLARLLIDVLGMERYDIRAIPNEQRPEANWDAERPWPTLLKLLESLGCRIGLDTDDVIRVFRLGVGSSSLPVERRMQPPAPGVAGLGRPDSVMLVGNRVLWEVTLELEAVGLDEDNTTKLVDELSYWPDENWGFMQVGVWDDLEDWTEEGLDDEEKDRRRSNIAKARGTVYKWYRIKQLADGTLKLPLFPHPGADEKDQKVSDVRQIYALDRLIETKTDGNGVERPVPAYVEGVFLNTDEEATDPGTRWDGGFSINAEEGIVQLSSPAYRDSETKGSEPAKLFLRAACAVRNNNNGWIRYWKVRKLGRNAGTKPLPVRRDEILATINVPYTRKGEGYSQDDTPEDNRKTVNREAERYLDYYAREHYVELSDTNDFAGFGGRLDGRLRQVTWSLSGGVATTRMSLSTQHDVLIPPYEKIKEKSAVGKIEKLAEDLVAAQAAGIAIGMGLP